MKKSNNHIISKKKKETIYNIHEVLQVSERIEILCINKSFEFFRDLLWSFSYWFFHRLSWIRVLIFKVSHLSKRSENFLSNRLKRWYLKSKHWIAIEYKIKRNRIRNRLTLFYPVIEASARFVVQLLFSARDLIWFGFYRKGLELGFIRFGLDYSNFRFEISPTTSNIFFVMIFLLLYYYIQPHRFFGWYATILR